MFEKLRKRLPGKESKRRQLAALLMLAGSGLGLLASFVLSIESLTLARNSHAVLNCDLNAAMSCSTVANHWSAAPLGFPNSFIGMMTLPVMVTMAGLLFAGWMFYMSYVEIGALCPWCLTLDAGMLLIFYGLTRHNVLNKIIEHRGLRRFVDQGYDTLVLASVAALIIMAILAKFGSQII